VFLTYFEPGTTSKVALRFKLESVPATDFAYVMAFCAEQHRFAKRDDTRGN